MEEDPLICLKCFSLLPEEFPVCFDCLDVDKDTEASDHENDKKEIPCGDFMSEINPEVFEGSYTIKKSLKIKPKEETFLDMMMPELFDEDRCDFMTEISPKVFEGSYTIKESIKIESKEESFLDVMMPELFDEVPDIMLCYVM